MSEIIYISQHLRDVITRNLSVLFLTFKCCYKTIWEWIVASCWGWVVVWCRGLVNCDVLDELFYLVNRKLHCDVGDEF